MTILNLSALDYGGAGKFSVDFNDLLRQSAHDSYLVVMDRKSDAPNVIQYPDNKLIKPFSKLARKFSKSKWSKANFEYDYYYYNLYERYTTISAKRILDQVPGTPDVIFIHWVTDFINAEIINDLYSLTKAKIYWLMIDNAPLTGGCHYPWSCEGYKNDCGACPAIISPANKWLAKENLRLKLTNLPQGLSLMTFSESDYERAKQSRLFKNRPINRLLGFVDDQQFKPGDKEKARSFFGLSNREHVIFFGASYLKDKRKGMQLLLKAIDLVQIEPVTLLIAGDFALPVKNKNTRLVGHLNETDLIKAYQAADVFVCPSIEDSGPIMINQSIMCGTPVVAFNTGVAMDLVHTGKTGYCAKVSDYEDLAKGISEVLRLNSDAYTEMAKNCRDTAMALYSRSKFQSQIDKLLVA